MRTMPTWLLPDHFSDILPDEAEPLEQLRRRLLDLFHLHGYRLFQPPLLEHIESLGASGDQNLDLRSFRLSDPISGRQLGLRADITPQAARVDAHVLQGGGLQRLCYAASAVHALPDGLLASREPIQIGCELFGHAGIEADLEILELSLVSLSAAGLGPLVLDLTDRGIFGALVQADPSLKRLESEAIQALSLKDKVRLAQLAPHFLPEVASALEVLMELHGPVCPGPACIAGGLLDQARLRLPSWPAVSAALDRLQAVLSSSLLDRHPQCTISLDLADQEGWHYHTGILFSVYAPGLPDAIARGGRYDGMGEAFGAPRPATGFSLELRALQAAVQAGQVASASTFTRSLPIAAPWGQDDPALRTEVDRLRAEGQPVVYLPPLEHQAWTGPVLMTAGGRWLVVPSQTSDLPV